MYLKMYTLILIIFVQSCAGNNLFDSISDMETLVDTEAKLIDTLKLYVQKEESILKILERHLSEYEFKHNSSKIHSSMYPGSPINSFLMIKRLTKDWYEMEKVLKINRENVATINNLTSAKNVMNFPTKTDLQGAIIALARLQETYKLNTTDIANGDIAGLPFKTKLTAKECYLIGEILFWQRSYYYAAMWLQEAKNRLSNNEDEKEFKIELLKYLSDSLLEQYKTKLALDVTNELLEYLPSNRKALQDKEYFISVLENLEDNSTHPTIDENLSEPQIIIDSSKLIPTNDYDIHHQKHYEKLCRNEVQVSSVKQAALRCKYVTNRSAFLKIAPLKLEEASLDPYIVIYHDVLYDSEISTIMDEAKPRLKTAATKDVDTGKKVISTNIRTSKLSFIGSRTNPEIDPPAIKNINDRTEDMTGLSVISAERLQVVNYGIGGQYEPHHDFYYQKHPMKRGNRIATVLFYMTTVERGGSTVFPYLDVSVRPVKGTAVVWMNLFDSGDGDMRTRHASCPVLIGSKWICNKWLHEENQEFLRPCTVKPTNAKHVLKLVEIDSN